MSVSAELAADPLAPQGLATVRGAQALSQQNDWLRSWPCAEQSPPHLLGFQFMRTRVSKGIAALLIFPPQLPGVRHPLLSVPAHLPTGGACCVLNIPGHEAPTWRRSPHVQLPAQEEGRGERRHPGRAVQGASLCCPIQALPGMQSQSVCSHAACQRPAEPSAGTVPGSASPIR